MVFPSSSSSSSSSSFPNASSKSKDAFSFSSSSSSRSPFRCSPIGRHRRSRRSSILRSSPSSRRRHDRWWWWCWPLWRELPTLFACSTAAAWIKKRVVLSGRYSTFGSFLSNRMIPLRLLMGNALQNFEEISRDHADEPSALRKEEERERRTVVSSTNPDRFSRGRFFFSLLSGAKRIDTQSTTPTHTNRREEREIRGVCVKKGPQKKA